MATAEKGILNDPHEAIPDASGFHFAIIVSEWNNKITEALFSGCYNFLLKSGAQREQISRYNVPGSFELVSAAGILAANHKPDAIICLGCVIQGETRHFDFICQSVADGIQHLNIKYQIPVIFGVLTPENQIQALERAGGRLGNKGEEAAEAGIKMAKLKKDLAKVNN